MMKYAFNLQDSFNVAANDGMDVTTTSLAISELTQVVAAMLEENIKFTKKNGLLPAAKLSRERLLKLLQSTELFNTISVQNQTFKLHNQDLQRKLAAANLEMTELKRRLTFLEE